MTGWVPTGALFRAAALAGGLGALAILLRRPDLLYLVAPLTLGAVWGLARTRPGQPRVRLLVEADVLPEGAVSTAHIEVEAPGAAALAVDTPASAWLRPAGARDCALVAGPSNRGPVRVALPLVARRWGRHGVGPVTVTALAADGLLRWGPHTGVEETVRVLPLPDRFDGAADVPQARGALGVHRSPRSGDSAELVGIRQYAPGDRLRRINWRVSLRAGALRGGDMYVNASVAERDAEVLLLLDGRYDAGASGGVDGRSSGLDVAVRATAALARFYLQLGDRVGLITHSDSVLHLPPAGGRRQLTRLLEVLLDLRPPQVVAGEPALVAPRGLDPRSLVVLLSPLVGRTVFDRAAAMTRMGHPVVVVDTLPADAVPPVESPWTELALRLWRLERDTRVHRLADLGVPIVAWRGTGSLDAVLRDLGRAGSAARVRR